MHIRVQGILHDLSKYSLTELSICKYYNGSKSPHEQAREILGYSPSWIHHKHKNKHHWQYWVDDNEAGNLIGIKIPYKYIVEMFCDMVGASKTYLKDTFTYQSPLNYYLTKCRGKQIIHEKSASLLYTFLKFYAEFNNEKIFLRWYNVHRADLKYVYN